MPTTAPDNRIAVVVGIVPRDDGRFLVQQRLAGRPCAGLWEFPGGKIEAGESAAEALVRELREELGIEVASSRSLFFHRHDYSHARVRLEVFMVEQFAGQPQASEGQALAWGNTEEIRQLDVLAAVYPILDKLVTFSGASVEGQKTAASSVRATG